MATINTPKDLPAVHSILRDQRINSLIQDYGISVVTECAQDVLSEASKQVLIGNVTSITHVFDARLIEVI